MKQNLLKNTITAGMVTCLLGSVAACTSLSDDEPLVTEKRTELAQSATQQEICTAENQGNCIIRYEEPDLNLNQAYAGYAVSTNSSYQTGSVPVALSAPAGIDGLSVKDKVAQRNFAQQQADLALQPIQSGEVVCTGDACSEALFKTEIEKTIQSTVTENQTGQTGYIYVAADGQVMHAPVNGLVTPTTTAEEIVTKQVAVSGQPVEVQQGTQPAAQTTQADAQTAQTPQVAETATTVVSLKERLAFGESIHDWEAPAGESLRNLLMRWGELSGWTVVWKLDRDYNLEAGVVFRGRFTEVAAAFIRSFARATPAPIGTFYKGNRVLVINTQENENAD